MATVLDEVTKQVPELDIFVLETKMRKEIHSLLTEPITFVKNMAIETRKDNDIMK